MKRFLTTILTVLYMISATGATVHLHYCMGKFIGVALSHDEHERCDNCGMKKNVSKGCCKDIHKSIKASDHQSAKANFEFSFQASAITTLSVYAHPDIRFSSTECKCDITKAHAPPALWRTCPIYKQVQNFRI